MIMTMKNTVVLSFACLLLAGCTSMNFFKDDAQPAPSQQSNVDLPPEEPAETTALEPTGASLSASQITKSLSGKSWRWSSPKNSGVTLYANDGSSLVEVSGKGTTTGKWVAKDGQLCESMAPADFLPGGIKMTCQPVKKDGAGYKVGAATFRLDG
jgi:glucose/arabinose dehydrogenase